MGDRPLRVLMVIFRFPPILGGAEMQAARLASELARRGVRVSVVTARFRDALVVRRPERAKETKRSAVGTSRETRLRSAPSLTTNPEPVPIHRIFCPTEQAHPSRLGVYSFMLSLAMFLIAHARGYNIIHAHQGMFAAALAVTVGKWLGKKTIVKFGGQGANSDFANLRQLRFGHAMSRAILRADVAIATSAAIQHDLLGYGFRPDQIAAIPNGVDTRAFAPARATRDELGIPREARVALFVGSLRAVKGVDVLLEAWTRVARECRTARLLIVGGGAERAALEARATRLSIADSVEFRGEQSDLRPYYWASDVFVLPSRSEGFPNVILEALAAGLPCVASNVGGIPDQITANENGLLVPSENADALADALIQFLCDDAHRREMSDNAHESARRFDWEVIVPQYVELYRKLCAS